MLKTNSAIKVPNVPFSKDNKKLASKLLSKHLTIRREKKKKGVAARETHLQVIPHVASQVTLQVILQVKKILPVIKGAMTRGKLMAVLGLKDRANFMKKYLEPSLSENFIEMTQPDLPKSLTQKYRIIEKGKRCLEGEREESW